MKPMSMRQSKSNHSAWLMIASLLGLIIGLGFVLLKWSRDTAEFSATLKSKQENYSKLEDELRQDIDSKRQQIDQLMLQVDQQKNAVTLLEDEKAQLRRDKDACDANVSQAKQDLEQEQGKASENQAKVDTLSSRINDLDEQLKQSSAKSEEIQGKAEKCAEELEGAQSREQAARKDLDETKEKLLKQLSDFQVSTGGSDESEDASNDQQSSKIAEEQDVEGEMMADMRQHEDLVWEDPEDAKAKSVDETVSALMEGHGSEHDSAQADTSDLDNIIDPGTGTGQSEETQSYEEQNNADVVNAAETFSGGKLGVEANNESLAQGNESTSDEGTQSVEIDAEQ